MIYTLLLIPIFLLYLLPIGWDSVYKEDMDYHGGFHGNTEKNNYFGTIVPLKLEKFYKEI